MTELALDHEQRDPLARHLHRVRVAQLVRREAPPDAGAGGDCMKLCADAGRRPWPSAGWATENAEQHTDRQRGAQCEPGSELIPGPAVHADFAALAAFAVSDHDRASAWVQIAFGEREGLADP
jgi:hypothetical protein